ncbi:MAG TPA: sigma-70 family RNA polymerase sigma factor, partial [Chthonomonadaceae bacterium]|nr:sigma-70 family RNA polymerase sigma factor [Chthonomonadaceae bacterium]
MQDDKRLVKRIQQGDRGAFEEFVDTYGARVQRLVRRYVENASDGEDVMQEIFCDLYRSLGGFRGDSALSTWVYRVAVNHCLKYRQRTRPECVPYAEDTVAAESEDWHVDPIRAAVKGELRDQVQSALTRLSPWHYDVVVLCELHGLTYQECAKVLDIPVGTVKSRLSNAFRRLRDSLGDYILGEGSPLCAEAVGERTR